MAQRGVDPGGKFAVPAGMHFTDKLAPRFSSLRCNAMKCNLVARTDMQTDKQAKDVVRE